MELEVLDLVRIVGNDGSAYIESVTYITPRPNIVETDHFDIDTNTLQVESNLGNDDGTTYVLKQVWRRDRNDNYMLIWENGKGIGKLEDKGACQCPDSPCDIPYEQYMEVCKERDELKEIVVEQAKEIYNLKQVLKYKEN